METPVDWFRAQQGVDVVAEHQELSPRRFDAARESGAGEGFGVGTVVVSERGVALVRTSWSDGWVLPGGTVEPGEPVQEAARREVREELGIEAEIGDPIRVADQTFVCGEEQFENRLVLFEGSARTTELTDTPGEANEGIREIAWHETLPEPVQHADLLGEYVDSTASENEEG